MLKRLLSCLILAAGLIPLGHAAGLAAQTSDAAGVKVTVTPPNFSMTAWDFEVTLETHTRNLKDDLARSSTLIADGKRYPPLSWDGAPGGGHHRKGRLRFTAAEPRPQSVELRITLNGETAPRTFRWDVKGSDNGK